MLHQNMGGIDSYLINITINTPIYYDTFPLNAKQITFNNFYDSLTKLCEKYFKQISESEKMAVKTHDSYKWITTEGNYFYMNIVVGSTWKKFYFIPSWVGYNFNGVGNFLDEFYNCNIHYDLSKYMVFAPVVSVSYTPSYDVGGITDPNSVQMSSWYKAHLMDKKQNEIIQGKFIEFTNVSNSDDVQKIAVVGGGILASGFKGATSTVDSFRVLTNAKLKPGTYKEALDSALNIKNSMPKYNMFDNVNGYKYVGMFKITPDATKVEELKQAGDTVTGTIASAGGYVLATGKKLLMEALGFTFNTQAGLWMMRTSLFLTLSQSTGQVSVTGQEGQLTYQRTSSTDVTGMNDPALEKQSDYWDAVSDYYKEKEQEKIDNNETPEDDTTAETEENPVNDVMENIKTLWEKISGLVENAYNNIDTKNDILNVEHEEATQMYDNGLTRPQAKVQAYELEYSKQVEENYTDTAGNTNSILKGSKANTKLRVRKDIEQHVKDYSDNESYVELNNFAPSEYLHEEQEIVPNSTYEEKEYKIMALAMELVSGTITKEQYDIKLNELR